MSSGRGAPAAPDPALAGLARPIADPERSLGGSPAIWMRNVTKRFGSLVALDDVSLEVPFGTMLGVIGPSGAGKTTAVRMITGGLEPTSGEARVLGERPRAFRRHTRERIGYMPQQFVLYPDLTVTENVSFVASLFGMLWRHRRRRVREVLRLVDLYDARRRRASELSGGMQRRLELACALVHDPQLVILDEPTAGLDPLLRRSVWDELHRLREAGRTLVVTTQYVGEAEECDEVVLIADGRLIAFATPDDLRRQALGGEVIAIETDRIFDARVLAQLPMVHAVRQPGPRQVWVITEDAGAATPAIMEAVTAAGGEVTSAREYRPSFDEVFAELVQRDAAASDAATPAEAGDAQGDAQTGDAPVAPS
jgi:ABC-2 type transport system ATP-binding protein